MQQEFTTKDTMGGRRSQNTEFRSQKDEEGMGDGVKGEVLLGNLLISGEMDFSPRRARRTRRGEKGVSTQCLLIDSLKTFRT